MRTNGFILIALGFTAASLAGPSGYLPSLGPAALRFAPEPKPRPALIFPALLPQTATSEPAPDSKPPEEVKTESSTATSSEVGAPVTLPMNPPTLPAEPLPQPATNQVPMLIGPMMDSGTVINPQMFLRYFTPLPGGGGRETVVVPPPGFNPAQPPTASSTATYEKIKP